MIDNALILLREELSSYMIAHSDPASVVVDNVSRLGAENSDALSESIIISLVNIEQEKTLKNTAVFQKTEVTAFYQNPELYLNLYILIAAHFTAGTPPNNGYLLALRRLSMAIRFFQGKSVFTPATAEIVLPPPLNDLGNPDINTLKLTLELYTLSFEQVNHLWGSLGGRQLPSVMYKVRLVTLSERKILREAPLIQEVDVHSIKMPN